MAVARYIGHSLKMAEDYYLARQKTAHNVMARHDIINGKADFDGVRSEINNCTQEFYSSDPMTRTVNNNWEKLKEGLQKAKELFVPSKMSSTRENLPWINTKIKCLIKARNRIHKKAKQTGDAEQWEKFRVARKAVKQLRTSKTTSTIRSECG